VTETFVHRGTHFFKGEVRFVSAADAEYFCSAGWAKAEGHRAGSTPADVTLDVRNGRHVSTDTFLGVKQHG
jgi:hypothetical protein